MRELIVNVSLKFATICGMNCTTITQLAPAQRTWSLTHVVAEPIEKFIVFESDNAFDQSVPD